MTLDSRLVPNGRTVLLVVLTVLLAGSVVAPAVVADDSDARFEDNTTMTEYDSTATLNVSVSGTTGFALESDRGLVLTATLVDGDDDGGVTLLLDTGNVSGDATLEAAGDDSVRNVSVTGAPDDGRLLNDDYTLLVGSDPLNAPTDIGTLVVSGGPTPVTPTSTATPESTPTATPKHVNGTVIVHQGEFVTVQNSTGSEIHGETHLDPGTELTIRVRSTADTTPGFFESAQVTVDDDGHFFATVDLSAQSAGDRFTVSVLHDGRVLTSLGGRVVECANCATPMPTPTRSQRGPLSFPNDTVHVVQSNVADIVLDMGNTTVATLVIGDEKESGYELVVRVDETPGGGSNGRAVVGFWTSAAGREEYSVSDESRRDTDSTVVIRETELARQLSAGNYELRLYAGNGTDGQPVDTATLAVHDAPTWEELNTTGDEPATMGTAGDPTTTVNATADPVQQMPIPGQMLYGVGGLTVGGGLGIAGVLLLLRGGI